MIRCETCGTPEPYAYGNVAETVVEAVREFDTPVLVLRWNQTCEVKRALPNDGTGGEVARTAAELVAAYLRDSSRVEPESIRFTVEFQ